jgi:energy-converting hydrogenase Eha subunit F
MANYTIKAIDTDTYGVIMEHKADTREQAEQLQRNMGNGDGYITVIIASAKEAARQTLASVYAKAGA